MDEQQRAAMKLLACVCVVSFLLGAGVMWLMLSVEVSLR